MLRVAGVRPLRIWIGLRESGGRRLRNPGMTGFFARTERRDLRIDAGKRSVGRSGCSTRSSRPGLVASCSRVEPSQYRVNGRRVFVACVTTGGGHRRGIGTRGIGACYHRGLEGDRGGGCGGGRRNERRGGGRRGIMSGRRRRLNAHWRGRLCLCLGWRLSEDRIVAQALSFGFLAVVAGWVCFVALKHTTETLDYPST